MMGHKEPMKGGAEFDAFSRWRKHLHWTRGHLAWIKKHFNRRVRREARAALEAKDA